jgi:hypothetical protein
MVLLGRELRDVGLLEIVASHPFRRKKRKGWGTERLWLIGLGFELGQERGIDGAAVELGQAKVAIEANAG